jgi:hypothetical protein
VELVLFTKEKIDGFIGPVLLNGVIHPTKLVKYVEAILDAKLIQREHVK